MCVHRAVLHWFAEAYLSFAYRLKNDCGEWVGGPMYYLQAKMPKRLKWFAIIFAFFHITVNALFR